jgi:four helix bundle protein
MILLMNTNPSQIKTFEDLECWKQCRALRVFVAKTAVAALPNHERHRLGDQILRAARSATANIAEGYGRFHYLDKAKFCSNALGSCWEVLDHFITARDEELISDGLLARGRELVDNAVKLLNGYMKYLKQSGSSSGDTRAVPARIRRLGQIPNTR